MSGRLDHSNPLPERFTADPATGTLTQTVPPADSTPASGTLAPSYFPVLPRYQYHGPIGHGSMGQVVRARDLQLKRDVAIKFLLRPHDAPPWVVERFAREARILAQLDHPNVVPVYDSGEADGFLYFVMKLVPGGSLARQAKGVCPDARRAAALVRKVAEAVQHVHEKGMLHRDLKPGNVLVDEDGEPLVVDFGVAKWDDGQAPTGGLQVFGTPAYMAPEVWKHGSKGSSPRSDVWSLGVTLYELLAGERPFPGDRYDQKLVAGIQNQSPPPLCGQANAVPGIDDALEAIVLKCLAKNPDDRYQSAAELADDLGRWLGDEPRAVPPLADLRRAATAATPEEGATTVTVPLPTVPPVVRKRRWRWWPALAVGTILAAVGILLAPVLWPKSPKKKPTLAERLLIAGDSVEFIGAAGLPLEQVGEVAGSDGRVRVADEGVCEVSGVRAYLLELGDEPLPFPIRLSAEVRVSSQLGDTKAGVYTHRRAHPQPDGSPVHVLFANCFGAITTPPPPARFAGKEAAAVTAFRLAPKDRSPHFFLPAPEKWVPVPKGEIGPGLDLGPFHTVEIDVSPTTVGGRRDGVPLATQPRAFLTTAVGGAFDTNQETLTGPPFGDGFGLFVIQGGGQFRNVRLTRLPE